MGWRSVPIREEIRTNALRKIAAGEPIVGGVLEKTSLGLPLALAAALAVLVAVFYRRRAA